MLIIPHDPDLYEAYSEHRTCSFHQRNPGKPYAGCTCMSSFGSRPRKAEDVARIKAERHEAMKEAHL